MRINLAGNELILDHRKVAFYEKERALILADLHIGKSAHFRKWGYSMPGMVVDKDIERLAALIQDYAPDRVYILGDLFHSHVNREFEKWDALIEAFPYLQFFLVLGNHDRLSWKIRSKKSNQVSLESVLLGAFKLTHYPVDEPGKINLCGHVHPGVVLRGKGKQKMKISCFLEQPGRLILPAFSELTGLGIIRPKVGDKVYACTSTAVVEVGE